MIPPCISPFMSLIDYKLECKVQRCDGFRLFCCSLIDYKLECKDCYASRKKGACGGLIDYKLECKVLNRWDITSKS